MLLQTVHTLLKAVYQLPLTCHVSANAFQATCCVCYLQGWRNSRAYFVNGIVLFISWTIGRELLFLWFFRLMWRHRSEMALCNFPIRILVLGVPPLLFALNTFWFSKICRGVFKLLNGQLKKVSDWFSSLQLIYCNIIHPKVESGIGMAPTQYTAC